MASDRHDHQAEAWFGSYLFVGFAQNGLAPILLPLASNGGTGSGLSYASFALTGLAAPILGSWADRTSRHRDLLVWGCFRAAACFLAMCLTSGGPAVIVWAGGAGLGVTAATTAANVAGHPGCRRTPLGRTSRRPAAHRQHGSGVRSSPGPGLAATHMRLAFLCAAVALIVAAVLATFSAPRSSVQEATVRPLPRPLVGGEAGVPGPSTMPIISTSASFANSLAPSRNRLLSFSWCG